MEHSVCKVSWAHHTKEWLSALFEALDGLELSVNNYLFTLLRIACRNKCLSRHLCLNSHHITTSYSAQTWEQEMVTHSVITQDAFLSISTFILSFGWMQPVSNLSVFSLLGFQACLCSGSKTKKSCWSSSRVSVKVPLVTGATSWCNSQTNKKDSSSFPVLFIRPSSNLSKTTLLLFFQTI